METILFVVKLFSLEINLVNDIRYVLLKQSLNIFLVYIIYVNDNHIT